MTAVAKSLTSDPHGKGTMVERRSELNRRYHRKKKMAKLKARLAKAADAKDRDTIIKKILRISPFWHPPTPAH
jgi:hypothetical protein